MPKTNLHETCSEYFASGRMSRNILCSKMSTFFFFCKTKILPNSSSIPILHFHHVLVLTRKILWLNNITAGRKEHILFSLVMYYIHYNSAVQRFKFSILLVHTTLHACKVYKINTVDSVNKGRRECIPYTRQNLSPCLVRSTFTVR